jgi:hypothetical protein
MTESDKNFGPELEPGARGIPPRPPKKTARGLMGDSDWEGRSILDEIEERLSRFPEARVKRDLFSITYLPSSPDGFPVMLRVGRNKKGEYYSVLYNGSRVDLTDRRWAVVEFGFGLSNGCRLKESTRKGKAYRWIVELWNDKERRWRPDWDFIGFQWSNVLWPFHRPTIQYLQNPLIDLYSDDLSAAA